MIPEQAPPPPQQNTPAEVQSISAEHSHRIESPVESAIDDFNQTNADKGVFARMSDAQNMNNSVEGIANGVAEAKRAKDSGEETLAIDNKLKGPGYNERPDENLSVSTSEAESREYVESTAFVTSETQRIESAQAADEITNRLADAHPANKIADAIVDGTEKSSKTEQLSSSTNKGINDFRSAKAEGATDGATNDNLQQPDSQSKSDNKGIGSFRTAKSDSTAKGSEGSSSAVGKSEGNATTNNGQIR